MSDSARLQEDLGPRVAGTRVLVVEDDSQVRQLLSRILEEHDFEVVPAESANVARSLVETTDFAVVLCDVGMPGKSGVEFAREIRAAPDPPPVVMVTAADDVRVADEAFDAGAWGYLIKPFKENEIIAAINMAIRRRRLESASRRVHDDLKRAVDERTKALWEALNQLATMETELASSRKEIIRRLYDAAKFRDDETADHVRRVSLYCRLLAERIEWGEDPALLEEASKLHDIGKIGVPDRILLKPGKLTSDEFEMIKEHTTIGYQILSGTDWQVLDLSASIALTHHERFKGKGYPRGLSGEDIPIEGRIAAIADVFDALTTDRVYRKAYAVSEAISQMKDESGRHFDPRLLEVFLDSMDQVLTIRETHLPGG